MSMTWAGDVYLDKPYLSIIWDRDVRCVYAKFKSFANSAEFREGAMKIIEAIRDKHSSSLISDNRGLEGVVDEDQLWIRDTWVPLAVDAGVTRIAVVLLPYGLGKIATEAIIGQVGFKAFSTHTFASLPEAIKWISSGENA